MFRPCDNVSSVRVGLVSSWMFFIHGLVAHTPVAWRPLKSGRGKVRGRIGPAVEMIEGQRATK